MIEYTVVTVGLTVTLEPTVDESTDAKQPQMPQMKAWQRKQQAPHAQQKELELEIAMLEEQLMMLRMRSAQLRANQQPAPAAPLPDDAGIHFCDLQHVNAHEVAFTLQKILGDAGPRIELPVSLPSPTVPKPAAIAAAVPPLDPAVTRSSA